MSSVDLGTVAVASGISALVSWYTARWTAERQALGQSQVELRDEVRAAVWPALVELRKYNAGTNADLFRGDDRLHLDDVTLCARIVVPAERLRWVRRRLVLRRCKDLFGMVTVETCLAQGESMQDDLHATAIGLQAGFVGNEGLDRGSYDAAFRAAPKSQRVVAVLRDLKRLAHAR